MERFAHELRRDIAAGVYRPGRQLPSFPKLATHWGVSQNIARDAVHVLQQEGLVLIRPGRGSYVKIYKSDDEFDVVLTPAQIQGLVDGKALRFEFGPDEELALGPSVIVRPEGVEPQRRPVIDPAVVEEVAAQSAAAYLEWQRLDALRKSRDPVDPAVMVAGDGTQPPPAGCDGRFYEADVGKVLLQLLGSTRLSRTPEGEKMREMLAAHHQWAFPDVRLRRGDVLAFYQRQIETGRMIRHDGCIYSTSWLGMRDRLGTVKVALEPGEAPPVGVLA